MSWNILLQKWYERDNKEDIMSWSSRLKLILEKINSLECDIICLQEVDLENASTDFKSLTEEYGYVVHEINKKRSSIMGNMILWRKGMFDLVDANFKGYAIHARILYKDTNEILWISNVHLKAGLQSGAEQRILQFNSCLKEWAKNKHKGCICGDFNDDFNEDGLMFKRITEFNKDLDENKILKYIGMPTCYGVKLKYPFDHAITSGVSMNYDHIDQKYEPVIKSTPLIIPKVKFPNNSLPSDHYPIKFILKL